jgi:hypothetical protein
MASNGVKNISFINCEISRFDAHRGFWNGTLDNVTIGHTINVIGGGLMYCNKVTKMTGNQFMALRGDYGATFEGDIHLINCELKGYNSYNSRNGQSLSYAVTYTSGCLISSGYDSNDMEYLNWDFGYTCYMPQHVIVDGFKTTVPSVSVFNDVLNAAFDPANSNCYVITKSITFKNMNAMPVTQSSGCTTLRAVEIITNKSEEK